MIEIIAKNEGIDDEGFTETNDSYRHFNFHLSVTGSSKNDLITRLDYLVDEPHGYFKQTDFLFITLGTAYEFRLNKSIKLRPIAIKDRRQSSKKFFYHQKKL